MVTGFLSHGCPGFSLMVARGGLCTQAASPHRLCVRPSELLVCMHRGGAICSEWTDDTCASSDTAFSRVAHAVVTDCSGQ